MAQRSTSRARVSPRALYCFAMPSPSLRINDDFAFSGTDAPRTRLWVARSQYLAASPRAPYPTASGRDYLQARARACLRVPLWWKAPRSAAPRVAGEVLLLKRLEPEVGVVQVLKALRPTLADQHGSTSSGIQPRHRRVSSRLARASVPRRSSPNYGCGSKRQHVVIEDTPLRSAPGFQTRSARDDSSSLCRTSVGSTATRSSRAPQDWLSVPLPSLRAP